MLLKWDLSLSYTACFLTFPVFIPFALFCFHFFVVLGIEKRRMEEFGIQKFGRFFRFKYTRILKTCLCLFGAFVIFTIYVMMRSEEEIESQAIAILEDVKTAETYEFNDILIQPENTPKNLLYLVLISSSALKMKHKRRREAVRKTWGNCLDGMFNSMLLPQTESLKLRNMKNMTKYYSGCRVLFFVGKTGNTHQDKEIKDEALLNKDLIVVDVDENYRNITWKLRAAVKFASQFDAKYIIKTDDDVYVNLPRLTEYIATGPGFSADIYGGTTYTGKVIRDPMHRHFVKKSDYSAEKYPLFCKGSMVLLSGSLLPKVVNAFSHIKPFNIDDAYLGISLNQIGVLPVRLDRFVQFQHLPVFLDYLHLCDFSWLVGVGDGLDEKKIYKVHKLMTQGGNLPVWMCLHISWFPLMCIILLATIIIKLAHLVYKEKTREVQHSY